MIWIGSVFSVVETLPSERGAAAETEFCAEYALCGQVDRAGSHAVLGAGPSPYPPL